ncbi:MAG TPA: insulinase family protein, partial [Planctomycetota bacterium]|nr:insulinase family protein [Planctomycetota bacterium]
MKTDVNLKPGTELHGFAVQRVTPLKNLRATAYELEHRKTGAKLLHVHSTDAENLFCIAFKTPPTDDTGLPHILEHSVLAGSKKFPVKDPFVEMVKMSMATFINAMTYSDKTVYPVASNVRQDFFNLAEVYCDAVFHPKLTENTFKQEGHHFEFAKKSDTSSDLIVKGIVYNEMKGAYSGADSLLGRHARRCLFPDTIYGNDSGGDPEKIPDLKYSDFVNFHQMYYHPSNSYIFIYGDIPTADHLKFLQDKLDAFERRPVNAEIKPQPRWSKPRAEVQKFPVSKDEKTTEKSFITLHWLVGTGTDPQEVLAWSILDLILLGNQGAPLRKALIDSKLGADLAYAGYSAGRLESSWHIGMKGSEADRMPALEKLVTETLTKLADGGITNAMIDAAFQQIAYRYLEIPAMMPLWLMDRAYTTWIYGADPLEFLRADEHLEVLRQKATPQFFGKLIRERLLSNPHRAALILVPDKDYQAEKDSKFAERMKQQKAQFDKTTLERIAKEAEELERLQGTPNPPEALATLPQLKVSDLPRKPKHIPTTVEKLASGPELLRNDVFANGINYLEIDVNLEGLDPDLFPYISIYNECFRKMGAAGKDYVATAERVAAHTGGVGFWASVGHHATLPNASMRRGRFSIKTLDRKIDDALAVLHDLVFSLEFHDTARLKDVIRQSMAHYRTGLVNRGLGLALQRAGSTINRETAMSERVSGVPQVRMIERLEKDFDREVADLQNKLAAIRNFMLNRRRYTASFTGSDSVYPKVKSTLDEWMGAMRDEPVIDRPLPAPTPGRVRAALAAAADVAFCAHVVPAYHMSHPDAALLHIGSHQLSLGYMWEEVRIKGGAYGGGCGYDDGHATWSFWSYRDPWVKRTLDTFGAVVDFIHKSDWSQADIDRCIIGTAKDGERPIRPGGATGQALWRHVHGDTKELREERHQRLLGATPKEVKR